MAINEQIGEHGNLMQLIELCKRIEALQGFEG